MDFGWREITESDARCRNLRISIAREIVKSELDLEKTYSANELTELFKFKQRDIKLHANRMFDCNDDGHYTLNEKTRKFIGKVYVANQKALPHLEEAEVLFQKTYGRYYDKSKENDFNWGELGRIYRGLHDIICILHWGRLPILNKYLMINSRRIPEENVIDFYDHFDMLRAMLKDIRGEGEEMSLKGDETLYQNMTFSVFTRRWGHEDTYRVQRTVEGWDVRHIAIYGACEKDGSGALFSNLDHDSVFYPEAGVKYAMEELWTQADEGELTLQELQDKIQQIADWISTVERAVGEGQPEWVNYY